MVDPISEVPKVYLKFVLISKIGVYRANTEVEIDLKPKYSIKEIKQFVAQGVSKKPKDKELDWEMNGEEQN